MQQRSDEVALLRAVLLDNCVSDGAAALNLREARRLGVDPLDYCAHRFGLGNALVWERAAHWANFAYFNVIPRPPRGDTRELVHLERLGEIRTLRLNVMGREILFAAPGFAALVNLAQRRDFARRLCIVPPDAIDAALTHRHGDNLMTEARQGMTRRWGGLTASTALPKSARWSFVLVLASFIALTISAGATGRPLLLPLVALLLVVPGLLRLIAAIPLPAREKPVRLLADWELPRYAVLIPLRDEAAMVPMLHRSMCAIDYPPEKVEFRFVVESRSPETVAAVKEVLGDPRFRLTIVPDAAPRTKPKALNYALPLIRGEYLVVYDAEDVPEPGQLRLAASLFAAEPDLACLQAELVPDNADENVLTALFAGEYAGLFGRLLPALARWNLPMPLGGTSNHFRLSVLRDIGGWDAANVTEDADLGVRLRRRGLRAEPFASRTYEEAPTTLAGWMAQRTRWMKGWMQTYLVHALAPGRLLADVGWKAFIGFHVLVGGMIFSSLLHTVFLGALLARVYAEGFAGLQPRDGWDWISVLILFAGYGGTGVIVVSGLAHIRAWRLLAAQVLLPFYWVLHSIAAARAAWELIERPSYWAKTQHGLTRKPREGAMPLLRPMARIVRSRSS